MSVAETVKRDYYEVLGVTRTAVDQDIKSSYRKIAMQYHPDRNADMADGERKIAEEKFKEASEAYSVLCDPDKRANYDRFGHAASNMGGGGFGGTATLVRPSRSRALARFFVGSCRT